jgi:dienelactone hydrolase
MRTSDPVPLPGFSTQLRQVAGHGVRVYEAGDGPPVVVIHEIPGLTAAVARLCRHLVDEGFFVCAPHLFGDVGGGYGPGPVARAMAHACISREFSVLAADRHSPIVDTLRALCQQVSAERGGRRVGAIGMCLTGNFALALAVDPVVAAPVLSQPSLPFPMTPRLRRAVHASPQTLATVRRRCDEEGLAVLGLRFTRDPLCPAGRFATLRTALGDGFVAHEIPSGRDSSTGISGRAHAVLARDFVDAEGHPTLEARRRVVEFLRERLS